MKPVFVIAPALALILLSAAVYRAAVQPGGKTAVTARVPPEPVSVTVTPPSEPSPAALPSVKMLPEGSQVFQTFNNCGPASLSMALSHYNIHVTQKELGDALRPYQNPQGDNDDKSVTMDELAGKAREYGLLAYHRPGGTIENLRKFIALGIPVITKTRLHLTDDIGHYRVVTGYDDRVGVFVQDDSMDGRNIRFTYDGFNELWKPFSYEYLVLIPPEKQANAEAILGSDLDGKTAWKHAAERARNELSGNPGDAFSRFNLSVALYYAGDYKSSVREFEKAKDKVPRRTLWYQIEPILSYLALGRDDTVLSLTREILDGGNRAFSELYILRGDIMKKLGDTEKARAEYTDAVRYNSNSTAARKALESVPE